MSKEQEFNKPSFRCAAYCAMAKAWKIVRDISAGALHLRDLAEEYLPKFPAEQPDAYRDRLKCATLFNAYSRTVGGLVGMVFKKNPVLSSDVPPEIRKHAENIDLAGAHFDVFAKDALTDAFDGHSFILVDMQRPVTGPNATRADEIAAGLRPYWVRYKASQAVNFRPIEINGQVEIGQITFEEQVTEPAGDFGESEGMQYRTFTLEQYVPEGEQAPKFRVAWKLRKKVKGENEEETYPILGEGFINLPRIPVAVVYGKKTGFLQSQPPLLDLALLNIKYFQKRSDYDESLHKAGFPIAIFTGLTQETNTLAVGGGLGLNLPANATATYMEPQGNSLKAAREDLQDVRGEMAALGLSSLEGRPQVAATATETVIDFAQESSEMASIARSLSDALELCLGFHAAYLGYEKGGGSVSLGSDLKSLVLSPQMITAYSNLVAEGQMSLLTMWAILSRGDALPEDFDPQTEMERIFGKGGAESDIERRAKMGAGDEEQPPANDDPGAGGGSGGDDLPPDDK